MAQPEDFDAPEALLTPSEVAALFRVNPKTVTRWARAGKLTAIRTLGGHRRFRVSEIRQVKPDGDGRLLVWLHGIAEPLRVSDAFRHRFRAM